MGTCFDVLNKPMPLMQRHVDIYRHKVIMGHHNKPRKNKLGETLRMNETGVITIEGVDDMGHDVTVLSSTEHEMNQEIPIDDPSQVVLHKEMFVDPMSDVLPIKVSSDFVDFAFTESGRYSDSRQMTLTNSHAFPVEVNWTLLDVMNRTTG